MANIKYNAKFHDDWAWSLAALGATDDEIAEAMKISVRTLYRWKKENLSFMNALSEGKAVSDSKVIRGLYQRAIGYEYEEEKHIMSFDKDGNMKKVVKIEKTKKVAPPDVGAQIFWLKNRQQDTWRDRPQDAIDGEYNEVNEQTQFYLPQKDTEVE